MTSAARPRSMPRRGGWPVSTATAAVIASLCVWGNASAATYNPDHLGGGQIDRVTGICQSVLRLHPSDPPESVRDSVTDPRLEPGENHYEACVATLSDSLRRVNDTHADASADANCRRQGYASESPALAECILNSRGAARANGPQADDASYQTAPAGRYGDTGKRDSIFGPSPAETSRRVELACARIGLNPENQAFDDCVKQTKNTFFAIENPQN
jgi:hypothetical protein